MMTFKQVNEKLSARGFRSRTVRSDFDKTGAYVKIHDYEHRKRMEIISVYENEFHVVERIEFTKVDFDRQSGRFSQTVEEIRDLKSLDDYLR